jgi:hypothetical protein
MSAFFDCLSFVHPEYPAGFTLDVHAQSFYVDDGGLTDAFMFGPIARARAVAAVAEPEKATIR